MKIMNLLSKENLIIGGGQLLNGTRLNKGLLYILLLSILSNRLNKKPIVVGIGSESLTNGFHRFLCQRILSNCKSFACRDSYTYDMLNKLGLNISKTADLVFLREKKIEDSWRANKSNLKVGIAVHSDPRWKFTSSDALVEVVKRCLTSKNINEIYLIAHDNRSEYDKGALFNIEAEVGKHEKLKLRTLESLSETYEMYENLDFIISARMHPLIIGAISGAKPVAISESGKVKALFKNTKMLVENNINTPSLILDLIENWSTENQCELEAWLHQKQKDSMANRVILNQAS